jgi:hypothetical protein
VALAGREGLRQKGSKVQDAEAAVVAILLIPDEPAGHQPAAPRPGNLAPEGVLAYPASNGSGEPKTVQYGHKSVTGPDAAAGRWL